MGFEAVRLGEGPRVEQQIDPFPGRELAAFVLLLDPFGAAAFQWPAGFSVPRYRATLSNSSRLLCDCRQSKKHKLKIQGILRQGGNFATVCGRG